MIREKNKRAQDMFVFLDSNARFLGYLQFASDTYVSIIPFES
jgi:hypothetical protein